jgi:hypothetical protein
MNDTNIPQTSTAPTRKVKRMALNKLCQHWLQDELLDRVPTETVTEMARQMKTTLAPASAVEVEPNGTVLLGMPCVEAARQLGWAQLEVTVRQDLDGLKEFPRTLEFIDLQLKHGSLSRIATTRCLARAYEIRDEVPEERRREYQSGS